ncbi:beta-glucosidase d [Diplodia corticola]|uniref:beta-glucosidase n=1 Tax=Diplodia corticola TaxID=236234 RepID=A0A1J9RNA1_9PEZI|nr:beta-glucosidase d [Diplodia corticola]OJD29404.1 beta-glucosidase d [Diplodia corticola]
MVARCLLLASSLSLLFSNATAWTYSTNYSAQLLSSGTIHLGEWQEAFERSKQFVATLSNSEKIDIITEGSAGSFPGLSTSDGSASVLDYYWVTTWPAPLAMAMTWDKELVYNQSYGLGSEMWNKGINLANAPTAQPLGRSPWGGRNGETYGPDAYLNGIMFGQATKGISDAGVIPAGKHVLLNEQETNREGAGSLNAAAGAAENAYSAVVDNKALHETYLWGFMDAVKNGLGGVMCAMNRVNGTFSCENQELLAYYLKTELGFPGLVYADVGGQKTGIHSANAGLDRGSSTYWTNSSIAAGMQNGSFTEARLDDMVIRTIIGWYKHGQDLASFPDLASDGDYVDTRKNHGELAREYAAASLVLLKNTNSALPLRSPKKIALFGVHAGSAQIGPNTEMSVQGSDSVFQGHMAQIGGSGQGSFAYLITPEHAFVEKAREDGAMLRVMLNDSVISSGATGGIGAGPNAGSASTDSTAATQTTEGYSYNQDVCLVFLNAYSGEGGDRDELYNTDQDSLVNAVAANCNNTVVVINTTGPRLVDRFITHENVTAVLYGGALGQESGNAIVDVLYGKVNPSGRLVHTIAKNESDYDPNTQISADEVITFTEGNYLDYKYFDKYNITPRHEFGFGLSYTTFTYTALTITTTTTTNASSSTTLSAAPYATGPLLPGGRASLWHPAARVSVTVSNTGPRAVDGHEVAQLYLTYPAGVGADVPARQLRGFERVWVPAGEEREVVFVLRRRDLSVWDVRAGEWRVEGGRYGVEVGASSRDGRVEGDIVVG